MEMFNSQDEVYKSQLPYRMSFENAELEISRGKEKFSCISIPDNDLQRKFLENAIADFIMFNPDALRVMEMVILNTFYALCEKGQHERSHLLKDLLKWMKNKRFSVMKDRLAKRSLAEDGFEVNPIQRPHMDSISITRYEADSRRACTNDYSISVVEKGGLISIRRIAREENFSSRIFSTSPVWGQNLLTEKEFRRAVALCLRLSPESFYKIANKLKKFVHFDADGKISDVTVQYFYLNYMASEEEKLRSTGKW